MEQFTGLAGKAFWEGTVHSEKTTLIINPGNWNTLQNHCYKFNIYTKSGGWSSCYYREGKHKKLPEKEAHLLPRLGKFILILHSHFTDKETELPKDSVLTNNMSSALYNSRMTVSILSWGNHSPKGTMTWPMSHSKQASELIVKLTTCTDQSMLDREKQIKLAVVSEG